MLSEGQAYLHRAPWLSAAPGAAIALTAIGWSLLGEGLRDALGQESGVASGLLERQRRPSADIAVEDRS
jgi:hypothetical protein